MEAAKQFIDTWVGRHVPSQALIEVDRQERAHAEQFLVGYGRAVAQFEVEFTALLDVIDRLNFVDRRAWPPHRHIQYALIAHNLMPLRTGMDRVMKGYYQDALAVLRIAYETFARLVFVSLQKDDPRGSIVPKPQAPAQKFNLTGLLRDQLRLDWTSSYSVLSAFTHSNSVEVLLSMQSAAERTGEPERLGLSISFNPDRIELVLPQLQFVVLAFLRFTGERLVGTDLRPEVPQLDLAEEAIELLTFGVRTHPKPYWQQVADDLDYVFDVIAAADNGKDWNTLTNLRPVVSP